MAPPKPATTPSSRPDAPALNSTAKEIVKVTVDDLASALKPYDGKGEYPAVFATTRMIALMELAAGKLLIPHMPTSGHLSVGVDVDITHSAGTPPGSTVTATAKYVGRQKSLYCFEVIAEDEGGEVGRGMHRRAIVDMARLKAGMEKRLGKGGAKSKL